MAGEIRITQADIDNLATKLDDFSEALSPQERDVLLTIMRVAGEALESSGGETTTEISGGRLSDGFRDAFQRGVGTTFRIDPEGGGRQFGRSIDGA